MNPQAYCEGKTRGAGSSFFYAFIFLPEQQRRAMMALYAFCREVDDIADEISDEDVALHKLGFWREEIERVFMGQPRHPVGRELDWARQHFAFSEELFAEIIDGMRRDVTHQPLAPPADLAVGPGVVYSILRVVPDAVAGDGDIVETQPDAIWGAAANRVAFVYDGFDGCMRVDAIPAVANH